jgi:hypothetical protein
MPALARNIAVEEHRHDLPGPGRTGRHRADEALVRLYIRFSGICPVFVVVTPDGIGLVSRGRDPRRAVESMGLAKGTRLELARVWWTRNVHDAATIHLAFAATNWPPDDLIPSVLTFARENKITLTSDTVVQAKARDLVEWVDADFETLCVSRRGKDISAAFGELVQFPAVLRRAKIRTLYRIAQAKPG